MNVDDPDDLEETLDIMGNPALLADIRESLAECSIADVVDADQGRSSVPDLWLTAST